jgi:hypothetical protein
MVGRQVGRHAGQQVGMAAGMQTVRQGSNLVGKYIVTASRITLHIGMVTNDILNAYQAIW